MNSLFDNMCACDHAVEYGLTIKNRNTGFKRTQMASSETAAEYLRPLYGDEIEIAESFIVLLLNRASQVTGWYRLSSGGRASTVVDVVMLAKVALDAMASAVVLSHNHPSGSKKPSVQDDRLTKNITDALKLFDIKVVDHVIITTDGHYSYCDEGRL